LLPSNEEIGSVNIYNVEIRDSWTVFKVFNNYFLTVAKNLSSVVGDNTDLLHCIK